MDQLIKILTLKPNLKMDQMMEQMALLYQILEIQMEEIMPDRPIIMMEITFKVTML
eukprot:CAMPEP_0117011004 /NCGR_PEP_ID=MMETSP0472-20121206/9556_1 /TAXON_ID=693140 ORGANISM="Tiarina fusus, Strain LIS" /NCGR_SAMPLE_ID=MMETSP0472 /ASSEMBLY_ACC=CAM_ASM_000603 /LENGTH=55 /DNA_ID=CAMNT_0004713683 /DNA_START=195 /DNA_END=362 /DNA_ORIENTATION=-